MKETIKRLALFALVALAPLLGGASAQDIALPAEKPNIVFIMTDDSNLYTYERAMPNTQALVADAGITFENATYSHSLCCPSRASILRGQYPHNTGVWANKPPNGGFAAFYNKGLYTDTYAQNLNAAGYRTGYFGKYLNGYGGTPGGEGTPPKFVQPGFDRWFGSTIIRESTFVNERHQVVDFVDGTHDQKVSAKSITFIRNASGADKEPFFAALNFFGPHFPEDGPDSYSTRFSSEPLPRLPSFNEADMSDKPAWMQNLPRLDDQDLARLTIENRKRLRAAAYVDAQVAKIIDVLSQEEELGNTYVIFYNDNGYHMGEHRLPFRTTGGKDTPYIEDIRFPIVVSGPGIAAGQSSEAMVQNIDLRPTFEEMAGVPTPEYVDGLSFLNTATKGETFPRTYAYAERLKVDPDKQGPRWRATYTPDSAYHRWFNTGGEEYYDLVSDPYELDNLLATGGGGPAVDELRRVLDNIASCSGQTSCHNAGMGR